MKKFIELRLRGSGWISIMKKPYSKTVRLFSGSRGSRTPDPLLVRQML